MIDWSFSGFIYFCFVLFTAIRYRRCNFSIDVSVELLTIEFV